MKETELFAPVKYYLENQGYEVKGEVLSCDITATKGDELVVVELKTSFTLKLVLQAIRHQEAVDSVYVAVPVPSGKRYPPNFKDVCRLLKRLELGLILVYFLKKRTRVEIALHPVPYKRTRNLRHRRSLIREIDGRYRNFNQGGSRVTDEKITAYKQRAIEIACCLESLGQASPVRLRDMGTAINTRAILADNYYGWFERVSRGVYALHTLGKKALENYPELVEYARKKFLEDGNRASS